MLTSSSGGAADVGNSELISTVAVASIAAVAVGLAVADGRASSTSKGVGVLAEGWNAVGVAEASGAAVTKIKKGGGDIACVAAGAVPHPASASREAASRLRRGCMWCNVLICVQAGIFG
jgi:hypothetical protein